jgi:hypothetical protein
MTGFSRLRGWRLQRRPLVVVLIGLVAVGLVVLGLVSTGSGHGRTTGAAARSTPTTSSGTSSPSSSTPSTPRAIPTGGAAPTGDPNQAPPSLAPVALDKPAAVGGVTAEVTSLTAVRASGRGPGNIAGPALRATVRLTNGTGGPVSLDGVAVALTYGKNASPASPVDDPSQSPFRGTVQPGRSAVGVYVFSVPSGDRNVVTVSVGYRAGAPFLVFTGSAR